MFSEFLTRERFFIAGRGHGEVDEEVRFHLDQQIGIRMAVGASRTDILGLVLTNAVRLIVPGVFLGFVLALALSRLMSSLLFNLGPHDPVAFASVTTSLILLALLASLIPGSSATRVNPTVALRRD